MAALDVDAARLGDLGPAGRRRDRARCCSCGRAARGAPATPMALTGPGLRDRPHQPHRLALQQEGGGGQREHPAPAAAVFERHSVLLAEHHGAAEFGGRVLDHQPALGRHLRKLTLPGAPPLLREHVPAVLPAPHEGPSLPCARRPRRQFPAKHRNEPRPVARCATRHAALRVHAGGWPDWTSTGVLPAGDTPIWAWVGSWISVTSSEPVPRVTWALVAGLSLTRYSKTAAAPGEIS